MKICYIADARSPIAQNWIRYFIDHGDEVYVLSSYPYGSDALSGAQVEQRLIGLSGLSRIRHDGTIGSTASRSLMTHLLASFRSGALASSAWRAKDWLAPLDLYRHVRTIRRRIIDIAPDLVHAMRIPNEGIMAALATPPEFPLLLSVWGNDFTLHAVNSQILNLQTRHALRRTNALHTDCWRDLRLAHERGLTSDKATVVLPGAGGLNRKVFFPESPDYVIRARFAIPNGVPVILNPRGIRGYILNDVYFAAIPLVLKVYPDAIFVNTGMANNPIVEKWITQRNIPQGNMRLLGVLPHNNMAELFRLATVAVSPSLHDGTPNTLLEAMACGAFPVAGRLESIEEWIIHEHNGLLFNPTKSDELAAMLIRALDDAKLRGQAFIRNQQIIDQRAEHNQVMQRAAEFYQQIATL